MHLKQIMAVLLAPFSEMKKSLGFSLSTHHSLWSVPDIF